MPVGGIMPVFQFLPVAEAKAGDLVRVVDPVSGLDVTVPVVRQDPGRGLLIMMPHSLGGMGPEVFVPLERIKAAMRPISI